MTSAREAADAELLERWQIQTPARLQVIGPSETGKSTLILRLLEDDSVWDKPFGHVVYCAPLLDGEGEYVRKLRRAAGQKQLRITDSIPALEEVKAWAEEHATLLILDDLIGFENAKSKIEKLVTIYSHHARLSLIMAVHNPFIKDGQLDMRTISRNITGRFLLWQVADFQVFSLLNAKSFPDKPGFLRHCLEEATTKYQTSYIFVNLHPLAAKTRRYRCYTCIFADERVRYGGSPIFFDLQAKI